MGQQRWGETQEQAPVLDHASQAQAGTPSPAPSHPGPAASADLTKRKHRGMEEGREATLEMLSPSPLLVTRTSSRNGRTEV